MHPLALESQAAELRHLLRHAAVPSLGQCDTPEDWLLIERSLRARDNLSADERLALRIAHGLLDRYVLAVEWPPQEG